MFHLSDTFDKWNLHGTEKKVPLIEFSTYLIFLENGVFTNNKNETWKRNKRKEFTSIYVQSDDFLYISP